MAVDKTQFLRIQQYLRARNATLVAVSKTKPVADIEELYQLGQRDFGENYVQELLEKQPLLPKNIRWHFIGHLQTNKVKQITSFIHLIQSVDSLKLLAEINKQAKNSDRVIDCLLQVHIAREETKFGFEEPSLEELFSRWEQSSFISDPFPHIRIAGFMGMATFTRNLQQVKNEFNALKELFEKFKLRKAGASMNILSMGMSDDYKVALEQGSNMVRIGSLLFGKREYSGQ